MGVESFTVTASKLYKSINWGPHTSHTYWAIVTYSIPDASGVVKFMPITGNKNTMSLIVSFTGETELATMADITIMINDGQRTVTYIIDAIREE